VAYVEEHVARAADEVGEARSRASDETPADPEQDQEKDPVAEPEMELVLVLFGAPPAQPNEEDEAPVEEASRKIPDLLLAQ
jgi:hypothetical protein